MDSSAAFKALISGRVQGVGFRYFAQTQARQSGLKGYARNLVDGRVEVLAVGERQALEALIRELSEGPPGARVEECQVSWLDAWEALDHFNIRP
jgi:acylphosphatase